MSENAPEFQSESRNLLLFIWRKRKIVIVVTSIAVVAATVISLLMTPMFKSTAIVFPAATSTVSFSEQSQAKAAAGDFGEEEQAEQLLQILQSARIRNRIVKQFDLFNHYEIGMDDANKNYKLGKEYSSHIQFTRTRYGSIRIDVSDRDRVLAAEMANKIVDLIDTVKNQMIKERTIPAFEINLRKRNMLETEKNKILAELDSLSRMGVVSSEVRANLNADYSKARSADDRAFIKNQVNVNQLYGARYDGLEILRDERIIKLTKFEDSYEQSESDANAMFNHKFIVEPAVVADKKDKPKRMIVVLVAAMGAFFFIIFMLLVKDRISQLRKLG
ncbi:MAG: tyrosine-protein kinase Etk/Wzc [Crocinitomicaceae bacterium]|jgi:tyrosine-protein kinase Etk/Wzc